MKTAKEMRAYNRKNHFHNYWFTRKSFRLVERILFPDEEVKVAFSGALDHKKVWKIWARYVFVLTNKRLIMAQKKFFSFKSETQFVNLETLNNVTFSKNIFKCTITFNTMRKVFAVKKFTKAGKRVFKAVNTYLGEWKQNSAAKAQQPAFSLADELLKYKKLLDEGVITQEELDQIKQKYLSPDQTKPPAPAEAKK